MAQCSNCGQHPGTIGTATCEHCGHLRELWETDRTVAVAAVALLRALEAFWGPCTCGFASVDLNAAIGHVEDWLYEMTGEDHHGINDRLAVIEHIRRELGGQ